MSGRCATRWPLLLVHGCHCRDDGPAGPRGAWGDIPTQLARRGARVYFSGHDAWGSVEDNAATIVRALRRVVEAEGCEKVNLIAHSKGGLDCRYLLSHLRMAPRVASLSTVATPHHGLRMMDLLCRLPDPLYRTVAAGVDAYARHLGDRSPDFHAVSRRFTTEGCAALNRMLPDADGVLYQSFSCACGWPPRDLVFAAPHLLLGLCDGANDGLVPVGSTRWGSSHRHLRHSLSHAEVIDLRGGRAARARAVGFYLALTADLKRRGF